MANQCARGKGRNPAETILSRTTPTASDSWRRQFVCVDTAADPAADPFDHQVLNGAQRFGLSGHRQLGDFGEEQRAAVGVFKLAAPAADADCRALFDAKELRLNQRFDQRGAVDGDERSVASAAEAVDLTRDELFAGPTFSFDQPVVERGLSSICRPISSDRVGGSGPDRP